MAEELLRTLSTDPECYNVEHYRQRDRWTERHHYDAKSKSTERDSTQLNSIKTVPEGWRRSVVVSVLASINIVDR